MRLKNKSVEQMREHLRRMEARGHGDSAKAKYIRHHIKKDEAARVSQAQ